MHDASGSRRPEPARGILFDAYGTLFDVYSLGPIAESIFPGHGAALAALWREKQVDYSRLRTLCGRYVDFLTLTDESLRHACERLGLDLTEDARRHLLERYARLGAHPDVADTLERLHAHGLPLSILSNGTAAMLAAALSAAGLARLFTHVLSADQVRKFKTAPEVYQLGVAAFGCPAAELVFVSSNGWDACCATWFGYRTFWVNRSGEPVERLGVTPTGEGRSFPDLLGFLGLE